MEKIKAKKWNPKGNDGFGFWIPQTPKITTVLGFEEVEPRKLRHF